MTRAYVTEELHPLLRDGNTFVKSRLGFYAARRETRLCGNDRWNVTSSNKITGVWKFMGIAFKHFLVIRTINTFRQNRTMNGIKLSGTTSRNTIEVKYSYDYGKTR